MGLQTFLALVTGGNANSRNQDEKTPLHLAAETCKAKLVKLLIDSGADVSAVDGSENTALHLLTRCKTATEAKVLKCLNVLIDNGVSINAVNSSGRSALHEMAASGFSSCVKRLIDLRSNDILDAVDNNGNVRTPAKGADFLQWPHRESQRWGDCDPEFDPAPGGELPIGSRHKVRSVTKRFGLSRPIELL